MEREVISVIIPIYNAEEFIDDCIASIVNQTYKYLEIILVDDGSTDNSFSICNKYARKDKRIKLFHKSNSGPSDTRNMGLDNATGKYVFFIDSDDILDLRALEIIMKVKHKNDIKSVSVGIGYDRFIEDVETKSLDCSSESLEMTSREYTRQQGGYYLWGFLYDNSIIQKNRLRLDTELDYLEDVAFNAIYYRFISKIVYIDMPLYHYRLNENSITHTKTDHKLLAIRWVKVYETLINDISKINLSAQQTKNLNEELKMCMNNIHSELFAQREPFREYKRIIRPIVDRNKNKNDLSLHYYMNKHCPHLVYIIYKLLFSIRK